MFLTNIVFCFSNVPKFFKWYSSKRASRNNLDINNAHNHAIFFVTFASFDNIVITRYLDEIIFLEIQCSTL